MKNDTKNTSNYLKVLFDIDIEKTMDNYMEFYNNSKKSEALYRSLRNALEPKHTQLSLCKRPPTLVSEIEQKYIKELIEDFYITFEGNKNLALSIPLNVGKMDTYLWYYLKDETLLEELRKLGNEAMSKQANILLKPIYDKGTNNIKINVNNLNINKHNPTKLVEILNKFTVAKSDLKHTTHNWDMGQRNIKSFLKDIKEAWNEIDMEFKNTSLNLHSKIKSFLFNQKLGEKNSESKQECIYSWGEHHLKMGWSSPELIKWCNENPKKSPFNYMLEKSKRKVIDGVAIDRFSDVINIFKNEIEIRSDKNQLMEIFFNLEENLPNGFNLDINDSLEGVEFYTDVESFKASLVRIFKMMQERESYPQIKVRAEKFIDKGYIELYLTQVSSTTHKEPQEIINKIKEGGGDMGMVLENLSSLCDWSVEYPFDNEKSYRINLLDSDTNEMNFKEVDTIEGFTHILRFYK